MDTEHYGLPSKSKPYNANNLNRYRQMNTLQSWMGGKDSSLISARNTRCNNETEAPLYEMLDLDIPNHRSARTHRPQSWGSSSSRASSGLVSRPSTGGVSALGSQTSRRYSDNRTQCGEQPQPAQEPPTSCRRQGMTKATPGVRQANVGNLARLMGAGTPRFRRIPTPASPRTTLGLPPPTPGKPEPEPQPPAVLPIRYRQGIERYSGGAISTIDKDVLRKTRTLSRTTLSQTRSTELFHTRSELSETKSDFSQTRSTLRTHHSCTSSEAALNMQLLARIEDLEAKIVTLENTSHGTR